MPDRYVNDAHAVGCLICYFMALRTSAFRLNKVLFKTYIAHVKYSSVSFIVVCLHIHVFCGQNFQNNLFDSEIVPAFVVLVTKHFLTQGADAEHSVLTGVGNRSEPSCKARKTLLWPPLYMEAKGVQLWGSKLELNYAQETRKPSCSGVTYARRSDDFDLIKIIGEFSNDDRSAKESVT